MANLPSIAQRLNDVEINNNAPVSSQTFRRSGSSVNYLLDLVGATNGDTNPTGPLGTILRPVATISYSTTFTNSPLNTPITLFTFEGGGDRPLKFFRRSSGFGIAELQRNSDTSNLALVAEFYTVRSDSDSFPIFRLLNLLATASTNTVSAGQPVYIVSVNGIEAGRTVRDAGIGVFSTSISYSREINMAPIGTNTVTVTKVASTLSNTTVTASFEYVAI